MKTLTAQKAFNEVQNEVENIKSDETASIGTVSLGDAIRQGDLYVVAIGKLPEKKTLVSQRQLAPGSSQGSRHVLEGQCEVYNGNKDQIIVLIQKAVAPKKVELHDELIGPAFLTVSEVELTHPEHGNRVLPRGEVFAVVYQRAFAEEVRRQLD